MAFARSPSPVETASYQDVEDVSSFNSACLTYPPADTQLQPHILHGVMYRAAPPPTPSSPASLPPKFQPPMIQVQETVDRSRFHDLISQLVNEYELAVLHGRGSGHSHASNLAFAAATAAVNSPASNNSHTNITSNNNNSNNNNNDNNNSSNNNNSNNSNNSDSNMQLVPYQNLSLGSSEEALMPVPLTSRVTFQASAGHMPGRYSTDSPMGGSVVHMRAMAATAVDRWEMLVRQVTSSDTWVLRRCWDQSERTSSEQTVEKSRRQFLRGFSYLSDLNAETPDFAIGMWKQRNWTGRRGSMFAARQWRKGGNEYFDRSFILHPDASLRAYWACIGVFFLAVDLVFLTMSVFNVDRPLWTTIIDVVYWSLDVIVCFRTAIFLHGTVTYSRMAIARHYLRSWFFFDILLLIYQYVLMSWPEVSNLKFLRLFRFLRMARLAKLDLMYGQFLKLSQSLYATMMVKICLLLICLMLWVHVSACSWYWIGTTVSDSDKNWIDDMPDTSVKDMPMSYFISLHWAASQLQGGIDVLAVSAVERLFVVVHTMLSVVATALLIGKLMTVLQELEHVKSERKGLMESAFVFMRQHRIPTDLCIAVQRQLKRRAAQQSSYQRVGSEERLFANLPRRLRRALLEESRWLALGRVFIFEAMHAYNIKFANKICCDLMLSEIYMPDDAVFHHGDVPRNIFFVDSGFGRYQPKNSAHDALIMDVLCTPGGTREVNESNMVAKFVETGTMLCEALMWVRWQHQGDFDIGAVHQVIMLKLSCESFLEQVMKFGDVSQAFAPHAARVAEHLNSGTKLDDLWCSEHSMKRSTERPSAKSFARSGTQDSIGSPHDLPVSQSSRQLAANTKLNQASSPPSSEAPGPPTWNVGGQRLAILKTYV